MGKPIGIEKHVVQLGIMWRDDVKTTSKATNRDRTSKEKTTKSDAEITPVKDNM